MYAGSSIGTTLWHTFDTFIMLETIFRQQGIMPSQTAYLQLFLNLQNGTPAVEY